MQTNLPVNSAVHLGSDFKSESVYVKCNPNFAQSEVHTPGAKRCHG